MSAGLVLVIDDDAAVRRVLERLLERLGYEPLCAADPGSALALLAERRVDLVLLDVHLGGHSGAALCLSCLHRWPYLAGRVVVMSGDVHAVADQWPPELRSLPTLAKPFGAGELAATLAAALAAANERRREGNGH